MNQSFTPKETELKKVISKILNEQTQSKWRACKNMFDKGAIRLVSDQPFPQNMFKPGRDIVVKGYTKSPGTTAINGQTKVLAVDPYRKWIKIDKPWPKGVKGIQDECAIVSFAKTNTGGCRVNPENIKRCQNAWNNQLSKAVKYWKDWLSHPETKKKVQKNWDIFFGAGILQMGYYYPLYMRHLNSIKLKFYNCSMKPFDSQKNAYAFVRTSENSTIYVNCSLKPESVYGTLIHEIQHMLYNIKPLNPEKKMRDLFVTSSTKLESPSSIFSSLISPIIKKQPTQTYNDSTINSVAKKLNVKPEVIYNWKKRTQNAIKKGKGDYICEHTEKMSNIISMRQMFNVQPGQNITLKMLMPFIKGEKNHGDVSWYLMCWVKKGFPDINQLLNKTNELAKRNQDQGLPTNNVNYIDRDPEA